MGTFKPLFRRTVCFFSALGLYSHALIGDWESYTHLDRVQALIEYDGTLFAGTSGGIREIAPGPLTEDLHNNPIDGIRDVDITGLVPAAGTLWGVSRSGVLYKRESSGEWAFIDRGFSVLGWKMNNRSVAAAGNYILLGSTKGLSFFSTENELVEFSVTQFDDVRNVSVTALHIDGPTLYAATSAGVYRADIHWDDPLNPPSGLKAFNPQIWQRVTSIVSVESDTSGIYGVFAANGGALTVYPLGSSTNAPVSAVAVTGQPLQVNGMTYSGITDMEVAVMAGNRVFAGNASGLYYLQGNTPRMITNKKSLTPLRIANVRSLNGEAYFWALDPDRVRSSVHKIANEETQILPNFNLLQFIEPIKAFTRGLNVVGPDEFYLGNWGFGVWHYQEGTVIPYNSTNTCLEGVSGSPAYVVVWSTIPFRDNGILIGTYHVQGRYKLSYLDFASRNVTCFDLQYSLTDITNDTTRNEFSNPEATSPIDLRLLGDSLLMVSHNKGLDVYEVRDVNDARGLRAWKFVEAEEALDKDVYAANIDNFGRLWMATPVGIFYGDNFLFNGAQQDTLIPIPSLADWRCNHIIDDGEGNLWLGCLDGLIYLAPSEQQPLDQMIIYTNKDGLLSNEIADLDIDKQTGHIWVVTSKGINLFQSPGRETPSSLSSLNVYPNPFKARHEFVVFDNLTSSSEVIILTRSGTVVHHAHPGEIQGGQWHWRGDNEAGRSVSSGIYYYVIKSGSAVRKGKLIVGR